MIACQYKFNQPLITIDNTRVEERERGDYQGETFTVRKTEREKHLATERRRREDVDVGCIRFKRKGRGGGILTLKNN